mgnify:CR=1 FL=1
MKKLLIKSFNETMIIEPINNFNCVHFHLKDTNLNEWNDFILDTAHINQIISFLNLQLKRAKANMDK